jgi:hypothetical protein
MKSLFLTEILRCKLSPVQRAEVNVKLTGWPCVELRKTISTDICCSCVVLWKIAYFDCRSIIYLLVFHCSIFSSV